jgi:hypothetical protein
MAPGVFNPPDAVMHPSWQLKLSIVIGLGRSSPGLFSDPAATAGFCTGGIMFFVSLMAFALQKSGFSSLR